MDETQWIRSVLQPYETILWAGKPTRGHLLNAGDIFLIPFSIFWFGFAIFWETTALTGGAPLPFALFGIPFILVGLYITVGRFIHAAWVRSHSAYAVTNQRLLRRIGSRIDTQPISKARGMQTKLRADGTGDLIFVQEMVHTRSGGYYPRNTTWNPAGTGGFSFWNIPDANRVSCIAVDAAAREAARPFGAD